MTQGCSRLELTRGGGIWRFTLNLLARRNGVSCAQAMRVFACDPSIKDLL